MGNPTLVLPAATYDDKAHLVPPELPPFVKAVTIAYFCLAGFSGLLGLNVLIIMSPILEEDLWPSVRFSDLLMLSSQFGSLFTAIALLLTKGAALDPRVGKWVAVIAVSAFLLYPAPALFIDPEDPLASLQIARGLYVMLAVCTGIGTATAQTQGYAYCGMCKAVPDASKLVALGFAMSGLYVWLHFTFARQYLFPDPTVHHQNIYVMVYVSTLCALSYIALRLCLGVMLRELPGFEDSINMALYIRRGAKKSSVDDSAASVGSSRQKLLSTAAPTTASDMSAATYSLEDGPLDYDSFLRPTTARSVQTVKKRNFVVRLFDNDVWRLYRPAFTAMLTFFVFPTIGPFGWPVQAKYKYYYVGVFQIGDLFGRLYVSWYVCSDGVVNALVAYRFLFVVPCYLIACFCPSTPLLTSTVFLVFLSLSLVLTHSLSFASAAVLAVRISKGDPLRSEAVGTRLSVSCIVGVLIGLATCKFIMQFR